MKKKVIYGVISVVIAITLFFIINSIVTKCTGTHVSNVISNVEQSIHDKALIDSMKSIQAKNDIHLIDSMNVIRHTERTRLKDEINNEKKKVNSLQIERDTLYSKYKKDTTQQSSLCDTLLEKDNQIISSQSIVIDKLEKDTISLSKSLNDVQKKYYIEVDNHSRTKDLYSICIKNTAILIKELQGTQTWWKRNEKWFYFGGGVAITSSIAAGLIYLAK